MNFDVDMAELFQEQYQGGIEVCKMAQDLFFLFVSIELTEKGSLTVRDRFGKASPFWGHGSKIGLSIPFD